MKILQSKFERDASSENCKNEDNVNENQLADLAMHVVSKGQDGKPFFVGNSELIKSHLDQFERQYQGISPCYDVSLNNNSKVLQELFKLGVQQFNCNNKFEVEAALNAGIDSAKITFINSTRPNSHLKHALANGINIFGFASLSELRKMQRSSANTHIQLLACIDLSQIDTNDDLEKLVSNWADLLCEAKNFGMSVFGVAITDSLGTEHDDNKIKKAIAMARLVFETGSNFGHEMKTLDLGSLLKEEQASGASNNNILDTLKAQFSSYKTGLTSIQLVARPGRFFIGTSFGLAVQIIGKRVRHPSMIRENEISTTYVVNESIFGAFNQLFRDPDSLVSTPILLSKNKCSEGFVDILGCSGDDIDMVLSGRKLPINANVGDWLLFPNMGCYAMNADYTGCSGAEDTKPSTFLFPSRKHEEIVDLNENLWTNRQMETDGEEEEVISNHHELEVAFQLPDLDEDSFEELMSHCVLPF